MIRIDKRVTNAALSLTQNYSDEIEYRSETGNLNLMSGYHDVVKSVHLKDRPQDVEEAIERLIQKGYLRISKTHMGGYMFSVTSRLNHRFAFFWGDFPNSLFG